MSPSITGSALSEVLGIDLSLDLVPVYSYNGYLTVIFLFYFFKFFSSGEQSVKNNREWFHFRFYGYFI